jgi:HAD superfamily 5'-nucleotidase-like hydrolase
MGLYVNRSLNLKSIKAFGFDMDHTLVRYNVEAFEEYTYYEIIKKLVAIKSYPQSLKSLRFDYRRSIQGLVIDKKNGNILKLNRYGKVKDAYHGTSKIEFQNLKNLYHGRVIDLSDFNVQSLDTNFSISNGVLFLQLIDLKKAGDPLPSFETISDDLKEMLDLCHRDGSIKAEVKENKEKYIIKDKDLVDLLLLLKKYKKKIMVITNSDIHYTKELLDFTINPFLVSQTWDQLFDLVITSARKPKFFNEQNDFLAINLKDLSKSSFDGDIVSGVFEGGNAIKLQTDLKMSGEEILYFGDHIYGDVVALKKALNWRTALVLDPLISEIEALKVTRDLQKQIDLLMDQKIKLEQKIDQDYQLNLEAGLPTKNQNSEALFDQIKVVDLKLSPLIQKYQDAFNPFWGELMRAGQEESRFADQMEKYACIYMTKIGELKNFSPRFYFRPTKRKLPHEVLS